MLEGTRGIASATAALVRAAGILQRELSQVMGKPSDKTKFYRKDSIFTQGLVSLLLTLIVLCSSRFVKKC